MLKKLILSALLIVSMSAAAEARSTFVFQQVVAPPPVYGYQSVRYEPFFAPVRVRPQCHGRGYGWREREHRRHERHHESPRHGGYRGYW
ncbi:MAG: hypothetical protein EBR02_10350 [Alphaproteobacteria bacterium]|nr:hypothetical protein [Alphaproteobacteria bacterium]